MSNISGNATRQDATLCIMYNFTLYLTILLQSTSAFAMNPQFHVEVTAPDTDHKSGLLVVGLMQKDNRKKRREEGIGLNFIGYWIYEVALTNNKKSYIVFCNVQCTYTINCSNFLRVAGNIVDGFAQ